MLEASSSAAPALDRGGSSSPRRQRDWGTTLRLHRVAPPSTSAVPGPWRAGVHARAPCRGERQLVPRRQRARGAAPPVAILDRRDCTSCAAPLSPAAKPSPCADPQHPGTARRPVHGMQAAAGGSGIMRIKWERSGGREINVRESCRWEKSGGPRDATSPSGDTTLVRTPGV